MGTLLMFKKKFYHILNRETRITHGYSDEEEEIVFKDSKIVDEDVVVDGNIITARGVAYVEFAVAIYNYLGFFASEEEADSTLKWLKNIH